MLCFRDTTKPNFLAIVERILSSYDFPRRFNVPVDSIRKHGDRLFAVSTSDGEVIRTRFAVIAVPALGGLLLPGE